MKEELELTILIPALNEEETIGIVIKKANRFLKKNNISGEVLVANNNSTDNTEKIAKENGARVVSIKERGYGNALIYGTKEARGKYVIMGDADDSYNFLEIEEFVKKLRDGYELVIGNRYGETMERHSMPFLHRYIGTPILTMILNKKYNLKLHDINCGLRGYNKNKIMDLECKCTGMEYASEMIIKAQKRRLKIAEIPIRFYKDKRNRKPHLNTIKDGIRHLKVILFE